MIQEIDMATHKPSLRKVLALGTYGSGKTHFIGTFPRPVLVFSFDKGYDTIAMQPGIKVVSVLEEDRQRPQAWEQFRRRWAQFLKSREEYVWPDGRKEPYQTFAIDGGTFLSDLCMNHYQYLGSNVDKKATFTQYQQILENIADIVNDGKRAAEYFVFTALIRLDKDELSGEILSLPALLGSIRDNIGAQFDAVFYLYTDRTPKGEEVYRMKTVGGYREKAKIRLPADIRQVVQPTIDNPNFGQILRMVSERIESVYGTLTPPPVTAMPTPQAAASPVPIEPARPVASPLQVTPASRPVVSTGQRTAAPPPPQKASASPIVPRVR